jgi:hypothetical protein
MAGAVGGGGGVGIGGLGGAAGAASGQGGRGLSGSGGANAGDAGVDVAPTDGNADLQQCDNMDLICSSYCSFLRSACKDNDSQFPGADQAARDDACTLACYTTPTWSCGSPSDMTGNTLYCRYNRAKAARSSIDAGVSPSVQCQQAGPQSTVCI